jgi:hypothetical protein
VYRLKHEIGEPVKWVRRLSVSLDIESGLEREEKEEHYIHRAVVFPSQFIQDAKYSITYLASNKNFVYGGFFGRANLAIVIDLRDFPFKDFSNMLEDKVILQDDTMYEVKSIDYGSMNAYIVVKLEAVTNG